MDQIDLERLAAFSDRVRDSTLKRLRQVPEGRENDTAIEGMMSPADIAAHLIESDRRMVSISVTKFSAKNLGVAGQGVVSDRGEFRAQVQVLQDLRQTRREFLLGQDNDSLAELIPYSWLAGEGEMDLGSMIYRLLDHEIHHRGALAVILRFFDCSDQAHS
jgi:uncharacterized damage-inducible protein DinB